MLNYYPDGNYYSYRSFEYVQKPLKEKIKELLMEYIGKYPYRSRERCWIRWLVKYFAPILKNSISLVIPYKKDGKVLDIGCGSCKLLEWLKKYD